MAVVRWPNREFIFEKGSSHNLFNLKNDEFDGKIF